MEEEEEEDQVAKEKRRPVLSASHLLTCSGRVVKGSAGMKLYVHTSKPPGHARTLFFNFFPEIVAVFLTVL